jgi:hypothetical protein
MRAILAALVIVTAAGSTAFADSVPGQSSGGRAFWLTDQAWPNPKDDRAKPARDTHYALNYTDELASRFGIKNGRAEFFNDKLGDPNEPGPAIMGTVDHGAAKVVLRWHPDE